ncbi:hypothetical protein GCM10023142_26180 [Anaerocolumna aminovalerica]|jgi:hypothetical protein|uniref:Uncharacterized protein n=1 Tax=Anaerocolumna aminovalerica TaxID=1527 RepID=A0A1I5HME6_9FIRM|nr:hypothetical protein SAMN04489757_13141 [Anaerocolumna aminovalerica]
MKRQYTLRSMGKSTDQASLYLMFQPKKPDRLRNQKNINKP